jgi:class 3 adenylate cyclase
MDTLPSGIVTFLFTDIEGSTRLFQQHPAAMPPALARHHALLQEAIDFHHGRVFNIVGDAFCAERARAEDAAAAALRVAACIGNPGTGSALRVRMGLHTGAADVQDGEYRPPYASRAQRVMNAGHGGQTLLSAAAAERVRPALPPGTTLRDLGAHKLRGLAEPETLYHVA